MMNILLRQNIRDNILLPGFSTCMILCCVALLYYSKSFSKMHKEQEVEVSDTTMMISG